MQVRQLGVRPYPGPDESLSGYCLRLAQVNGLHSVDFLLMSMGMKRGSGQRLVKGTAEAVSDIIARLGQHLGRSREDLRAAFSVRQAIAYGTDDGRLIKQVGVDFPRVCPHCIIESGDFDWRWSLAVVGRCPSHGTLLVDTCPACSQPLEWKSELFEGCTRCQYQWADHAEYALSEDVTALEAALWQALGAQSGYADQVRSVAAAIVTMARPYDSWHGGINTIPYRPHYSELVDLAYRTLSGDPSILAEWAQARQMLRKDLQSIGPRAVELPFHNLVSNVQCESMTVSLAADDNDTPPTEVLDEHLIFTNNVRQKLVKSDASVLRYQASHNEIAHVLCLPSNEVQFVIDDGPLKPVNSTSMMVSQIFDLRDLAKLIERNATKVPLEQPVAIASSDPRLTEHFTRYGKLVASVLAGDLPGLYSPQSGFQEVVVESAAFEVWLIAQRRAACQEPLTIHRVMAALRCGEKTIRDLVEAGHFHWARWATAGGRDRVDGPSLLCYLTSTNPS